jgi:primosomal replication protein N
MNRLVLSATLLERAPLRYTPAGLPALDLSLKHESEVSEDGQPRQVSMEMKAVAIGEITREMQTLALGSAGIFAGFVTSSRNKRGWLFHITQVDTSAPPALQP